MLTAVPSGATTGSVVATVSGVPSNAANFAVVAVDILTGNLATARIFNSATLLNTGKVLIAGGSTGNSVLTSAELYDPATGTFTTTGSMNVSRASHTATLLN